MISASENVIALALAVPLAGAVGIALAARWPSIREAVTLVSAVALLLTVFSLIPEVIAGNRPQLTLLQILPGLGLSFRVEPLGMIFAAVAALLWPLNSIYSIGYMRANQERHQTRFYICFAVALAATMGLAFSSNLITLFLFYEVLTLSTYPLVTHKGNEAAMQAGRVYLGILLATSIGLLLPAIIWTWHISGSLEFRAGGILSGRIEGPLVSVLLFLFVYGTGKAALMPIQRWLPAAMVAPTPVSALLHAVAVVKAGVFTVLKIIIYVFGIDFLNSEPSTHWLLYVAGFTIIVASVIALRQDNLKLRLAYSTVSQLSYVILGAAILAPLSALGAALHIAAHAFGKITLFFAAGSIYTSSHKTNISQLSGIGRRMPWTMGAFTIGAVSMIGIPPTAGFISKWYMLLGAFETERILAIAVIAVSTLLNAAYFAPIIYAAFFKPEECGGNMPTHGEAPLPIVIALVATAALTVLLFFVPNAPLELAHQLVDR